MKSFQHLPNEILDIIASELTLSDRVSLSKVNKFLSKHLERERMYRYIRRVVDTKKQNPSHVIELTKKIVYSGANFNKAQTGVHRQVKMYTGMRYRETKRTDETVRDPILRLWRAVYSDKCFFYDDGCKEKTDFVYCGNHTQHTCLVCENKTFSSDSYCCYHAQKCANVSCSTRSERRHGDWWCEKHTPTCLYDDCGAVLTYPNIYCGKHGAKCEHKTCDRRNRSTYGLVWWCPTHQSKQIDLTELNELFAMRRYNACRKYYHLSIMPYINLGYRLR